MNDIISVLTEKIRNDILNQPNRKLKVDEPLISSGVIDSFHMVDLALAVEEMFGVRIEDHELNADMFDTIEDLALLIQKRS